MYRLSDYDYNLPDELISHSPEQKRDASGLMHLDKDSGRICHRNFSDLADLLNPSDLLVVNNTRVVPARLNGFKETGGKTEVLIIDYTGGLEKLAETGFFECECLIRASKRPKEGAVITFGDSLTATVLEFADGVYRVRFNSDEEFDIALEKTGAMPLPPYISRNGEPPCDDRETYQTVYAAEKGAVAAPTAGLHFTDKLLGELRQKGIEIAELTLHVGYGTFVPVRVSDIRDHEIHTERFHIPQKTAEAINTALKDGRRIIAVGTTTVRTLEYCMKKYGAIRSGHDNCDLYIYPGFDFRITRAMITNFHIPKSTLLMLVSAFAGKNTIFKAYEEAIRKRYRFYSYGDAMFIE